jgi:hypothetical protein
VLPFVLEALPPFKKEEEEVPPRIPHPLGEMTTISTPSIIRPTISPRSYSVPTSSHPAPLPPVGSGSGLNKRPNSLLSRFRRFSQYDIPLGSGSSKEAIIGVGGDEQTPIPTLERMARRKSIQRKQKLKERKEKERDEEDIDWEKVKTLPRVCLTPPEGMPIPIECEYG